MTNLDRVVQDCKSAGVIVGAGIDRAQRAGVAGDETHPAALDPKPDRGQRRVLRGRRGLDHE